MGPNHDDAGELTDRQRSLLRTAVNEGYFKVPREISLVSLAEQNGLDDVEALEQLNRGLDTVVREVVFEPESDEMD